MDAGGVDRCGSDIQGGEGAEGSLEILIGFNCSSVLKVIRGKLISYLMSETNGLEE